MCFSSPLTVRYIVNVAQQFDFQQIKPVVILLQLPFNSQVDFVLQLPFNSHVDYRRNAAIRFPENQCSQSGTLSMLISGKSSNLFSQIDGRCSAAVSVAMRGRKPDSHNGKQRSQARTCDEIVFATF